MSSQPILLMETIIESHIPYSKNDLENLEKSIMIEIEVEVEVEVD